MHTRTVLERACCQSPVHPTTFRCDVIDLLYQDGRAARTPILLRFFNSFCRKADVLPEPPSTTRPLYVSCSRAKVLPEPHPPCDLLTPSAFKLRIYIYIIHVSGLTCCQRPMDDRAARAPSALQPFDAIL